MLIRPSSVLKMNGSAFEIVLSSRDIHSNRRSVFLFLIMSAISALRKPMPHCFRYNLFEYFLMIPISSSLVSRLYVVVSGQFIPDPEFVGKEDPVRLRRRLVPGHP